MKLAEVLFHGCANSTSPELGLTLGVKFIELPSRAVLHPKYPDLGSRDKIVLILE
jgi:hypothetical protein